MRHFILKIVLFVALLASTHLLLILLAVNGSDDTQLFLQKYSNIPVGMDRKSAAMRFEELRHTSDVDVLFIGSSHCARTFDPRYMTSQGYSSFNLGTAGQTPFNTYYLLERHLDKLLPELVVIETYWESLGSDGVEPTMIINTNDGPSPETLRMALETRAPKAINTEISARIERALGITNDLRMDPEEVYIPGGFVETWKLNESRPPRPREITFNLMQLRYLTKTIELLQRRKILTVLVWAPVPTSTLENEKNFSELKQQMIRFAKLNQVEFLDLNGRLGLDDHLDFFDDDHLNQRGVDKVMPCLFDYVEEHNLLPNSNSHSGLAE